MTILPENSDDLFHHLDGRVGLAHPHGQRGQWLKAERIPRMLGAIKTRAPFQTLDQHNLGVLQSPGQRQRLTETRQKRKPIAKRLLFGRNIANHGLAKCLNRAIELSQVQQQRTELVLRDGIGVTAGAVSPSNVVRPSKDQLFGIDRPAGVKQFICVAHDRCGVQFGVVCTCGQSLLQTGKQGCCDPGFSNFKFQISNYSPARCGHGTKHPAT